VRRGSASRPVGWLLTSEYQSYGRRTVRRHRSVTARAVRQTCGTYLVDVVQHETGDEKEKDVESLPIDYAHELGLDARQISGLDMASKSQKILPWWWWYRVRNSR